MKAILRKDGCLAAISERPIDFTDNNKWIEMDGNAMENFHLALADEVLSSIEEKKTAKVLFYKKKIGTRTRKTDNCNDHTLEIIGVGTIKLKMHDGIIKIVRDVRHVKGLTKNLLSYGLLDNNASKIETWKGIMKVFHGALVVLKGEKIATNLYMLKRETLIEEEASTVSYSSDSIMLWHQKLGHMSEKGMKVLVEQKLLPGLTKVTLPLCEHCITRKQHRLKFNTSNSRGKNVLELVHSDAWQAPVTSLGGAKYFVSFIDDYSRRCWVYPIKRKSDVFSTFKNFKARVELDSGNKIKTLLERTRAMLRDAGLEKSFWAEAVNTACYLVNRAPSTAIELKTPMEMWTGKPVDYSNLHVFGSIVYVLYNSQEISKLDPKSRKYKFLGYVDGVKGYRLWDPTTRKVIISRDVIFVEDKLKRKEEDDSTEKSETTHIHVEKEVEQRDSSKAKSAHDEQEPESSEAPITRQSDCVKRRPNWHSDYVIEGKIAYCLLTEDGEPLTYQETINSSDASLWMMTMQEEIKALHKNNTWDLVPLPQERKPIGNKWVFKIKRNGDDQVERLNKSLYGLKQAPRCWYKRFDSFIMCLGYNRLNAYPCAYFKRSGDNDFVILLFYVDDMLVARPNKDHIEELKTQLAKEFEMKDLGSTNKILGMQIHRDRSNRNIWLSQKNYLKKILSRFNIQDCKPISNPLPINFKLSSSMSPSCEEERMEISRVPYASAVGSLMFAMICTRPDIAQAVEVSVVPTSTIEAEYVAATQASKEVIWLKMLLELGHNQEYVSLFCDSQSALHLARNPTFHSRTKRIRVQYHFIREKVEEGMIDMQKIHTKDNIADFMTNVINVDKFTWCRSSYGLSKTEVNKEYSQEVRKVVEKLFRWLSMGLGLEADVLKEGAGGEEIEYMMKINYYPPCLRPDLTLGVSFHTDLSAITVLEPNDVPGLQVFKDGLWINAKYIPGSLIIHIGDQIEVTSIPFTSLNLSLIIFFD
ncbi:Flavonol synthase/flavanone 3-hydroxylase [Hibiscus syriacus]|uniref:Flavonol synthase/flavanone 3-hydroxylase n=1 Tax=Hibiscus syriacus TaxID=106335 RepID=A0A6A2XNC9_HIBSY|nr:Flavonol synthase/flavanone 3-hydroxylase [Hibiscus syriacus]